MSDNPFYGQIRFFQKNKIDLDNPNVDITVTDVAATSDGQEFADFMRDRKNETAWLTTDSVDANNTEMIVDFVDPILVDDIILVEHNLGSYTIEQWTGLIWENFETPINVSGGTSTTTHHASLNKTTTKIRITITGTIEANKDKKISQLIVTQGLLTGQLEAFPQVKRPRHKTNKKKTPMLSGKLRVAESPGAFSCSLNVKFWNYSNDLEMVEDIYFRRQGVLMWLSSGDESQFSYAARGYREQDIYLVRPVNDFTPEFYKGYYKGGLKIKMDLAEAID